MNANRKANEHVPARSSLLERKPGLRPRRNVHSWRDPARLYRDWRLHSQPG